jgi:putative endopeptidase
MQSNCVYLLLVYFLFRIPVKGEIFLDPNDLDWSIRPTEDFYTFVNGKWINQTVIPPSLTDWGGIYTITYETAFKLKNILDQLTRNGTSESPHPVDSVPRKLADLYLAGLDEQTIEKLGIQPLKETFFQLENIDTYQELIIFILNWYKKMDQGLLFQFNVYSDPRNSSVNMAIWRVNISLDVYCSNCFFFVWNLANRN